MSLPLTVGSLFAGIGGFDLGFERAGFEIQWQVEIDPFCRKVLEKHWPHARQYEDVREVHDTDHGHINGRPGSVSWCPGCLDRVDVLCGGFPCQDLSDAGQRRGIEGDRSGLWRDFIRLIRELRPSYVVVENVPALLRRGMAQVLGDLAACGYDAEWDVLGADDFGSSQHRKRLWILAYPNNTGLQRPIWVGQSDPPRQERGAPYREPLRSTGGLWPPGPRAVADIPRMADGPADRMDRLKSLGNTVIPQIAEWIANRIKEAEGLNV